MSVVAVPTTHELSRLVPSGLWIATSAAQPPPRVPLESFRNTRWFAVPENVNDPFCPGAVVVATTGAPPGVIVPVTSAGTLYRVSVTDPVTAPCGSTKIEYVPVVG